jgi:hypothetical protein
VEAPAPYWNICTFYFCKYYFTFIGNNMEIIISLIVTLIVLGLIWWLVSFIPLPEPFGQIVRVLFIILAVWAVLAGFGVVPGGMLIHVGHLRL